MKSGNTFLYLMICVFFFDFSIYFFNLNSNGQETVIFLDSDIVYSEDFGEPDCTWTLQYVTDPYLYAFTSELPKYIVKDEIFVKKFWYDTGEVFSIPSQIVDCASIHFENGFWWLSAAYGDRVYKCYENWTSTGDSYYVGAQEIFPSSIHYFNNSWWMAGPNSNAVHKYYDNWTYTSVSISVSSEGSPSDIFYQNGKWWMLSESNKRIYMYYDNWTYSGVNYYLGNEDIWPRSLDYWDGYWWVMGEKNDHIYKYSNNWTYTGESISIFYIDYWTSDIHISDGVLWYQGSYTDSIYKFNYEDLYQIPKVNVKDDFIFVQTDLSEVIGLRSPIYNDLTLKENSQVEVKFNTTCINRITLDFLNDMERIKNIEISPPENDNFTTQIVEITINEEVTFDQLQFIVDFNSYDNLKIDFIKIMKGPVIPDVKVISDTVYLEKWDVASGYTLDANKDDIIAWEFRTYDNPFIVYFRCQDPKIISHDKTVNKGKMRALVSIELRFSFENIGDTGGGYLEFEIKIIDGLKKIIDGYNVLILFGIISIISVVSIKRLTKRRNII